MQTSKIQFSPEELRLAENSEMILTKNRIIKKAMSVFGSIADEYSSLAEQYRQELPSEFFTLNPKISRGEQYLGLPYVILDYPRIFSKDHVFAIRSFFWWGNYFSLTLHLKGTYKDAFGKKIRKHFELLTRNDYCIAISDDEWRHDFEEENYVALKNGGIKMLEQNIVAGSFLKLAVKWRLQQGNEIELLLKKQFSILIDILSR
jgi:hypothetical protein